MIRIPPGKRTTTSGAVALLSIAAGTVLVVLVPTFAQHYGTLLTGIGGWLALMLGANSAKKWAPPTSDELPAKPSQKPEVLG